MPDREEESTNPNPSDEGAFAPSFIDQFDEIESPFPTFTSLFEGPWQIRRTADGQWGCYADGEKKPDVIVQDRYLALLFASALPTMAGAGRFRVDESQRPFVLLVNGKPMGTMDRQCHELIHTVEGLDGLVYCPSSFAYLMEAAGAPILDRVGRILWERVQRLRSKKA